MRKLDEKPGSVAQSGKGEELMRRVFIAAFVMGLLGLAPALPFPPAGTPQTVNDGYGDYIFVAAGVFKMGDNFDEGDPRERPVHVVDLDAYYIGKYPVTNGEFKRFRDEAGYDDPKYWPEARVVPRDQSTALTNGMRPGRENFPAAAITWDQAVAYCNWLSARTGKQYRLPTEAEWEKAARGADQRRYPWGNELTSAYASYKENPLAFAGFYDGSKRGELQTRSNASPYGAFDLVGAVFEWCSDWYSPNYYAFSPRKNPPGPSEGAYRVVRGASQYEEPWELRAANRSSGAPSNQNHHFLGFRCVRNL
jgi:formylglycine-generating enzyme required for sulfatase activity